MWITSLVNLLRFEVLKRWTLRMKIASYITLHSLWSSKHLVGPEGIIISFNPFLLEFQANLKSFSQTSVNLNHTLGSGFESQGNCAINLNCRPICIQIRIYFQTFGQTRGGSNWSTGRRTFTTGPCGEGAFSDAKKVSQLPWTFEILGKVSIQRWRRSE